MLRNPFPTRDNPFSMLLLAALLGAALAGPTAADEPTTTEDHGQDDAPLTASIPSPSPLVGSTVFVDPVTGELTSDPTAEQERALAERLRRTQQKAITPTGVEPAPFALHGGGEGMFVGDLLVSSLRIVRGNDGSWHQTCGDLKPVPHDHGPVVPPTDAPLSSQAELPTIATPQQTSAAPVM